jgi:hypothetical protein
MRAFASSETHAAWDRRYEDQRQMRRAWVGAIAGVNFDFRTSGLLVAEWECPHVLGKRGWEHAGWYFVDDQVDPSDTSAGPNAGELRRAGREAARRAGKIVVGVGDRVYVKGLEWVSQADDKLEPRVDQEIVRLQLAVQRSEGGEEPAGSVLLSRKGALGRNYAELGVLEALKERMAVLQADHLDAALLQQLQRQVMRFVDGIEQEVARLGERDTAGGQFGGSLDTKRLANLAALFGYLMGRAEAAAHLKPMALTGLARTKQSHDAGKGNADPDRIAFADEFFKSNPTATAYQAAKAYCMEPEHLHDDAGSVRRTMQRLAPITSPSYRPSKTL